MHANFVFRRHLGKIFWKIISKVNELCDVIGWVAPKLQERILLRACYVSQKYIVLSVILANTLRNQTREVYTIR
jgi:hypothetical protein